MSSTSTGSAPTTPEQTGGPRPPGPTVRPTLSPTSAVVAGLAVAGLDLRTARAVVDARAGRRLRARRIALGSCAAVAVIGLGIAVFPRPEPDDVVADADSSTTTSSVPDTTLPPDTVPVAAPAAPTTAVTTTTVRKPVIVLPPPPTAPPPTLAPNQPLNVSIVAPGSVTAGDTVDVSVQWSDPDFADPAGLQIAAVWGDPAVTLPVGGESRPACDAPGPGGSGTVPLRFRYATPGIYQVSVQASACDGAGAYGEDRTLTTQIEVKAPAGERVVVAGGAAGGRSPDAAEVTFVPASPTSPVPPPIAPRAELGQVDTSGGRVGVIRVPVDFVGEVQFHWGGDCQPGSIGPPGPAVLGVPLTTQACAAATSATTGSTVP